MPELINRDKVMRRIAMLFNLVVRVRINDQKRAFSVASLPKVVRVFV